MKKINKNQIKMMGTVFTNAVVKQLTSGETLLFGAAIGINQGLKYRGNVIRGIKAGAATTAVVVTVNGVCNVLINWNAIREID